MDMFWWECFDVKLPSILQSDRVRRFEKSLLNSVLFLQNFCFCFCLHLPFRFRSLLSVFLFCLICYLWRINIIDVDVVKTVVFATDGGCTSYTGEACQSSIAAGATVFIKASVNVSDSDAVIERWLMHVDQSSSCYSAARQLICQHVYPPCNASGADDDGKPQTRPICRQVSFPRIICYSEMQP